VIAEEKRKASTELGDWGKRRKKKRAPSIQKKRREGEGGPVSSSPGQKKRRKKGILTPYSDPLANWGEGGKKEGI